MLPLPQKEEVQEKRDLERLDNFSRVLPLKFICVQLILNNLDNFEEESFVHIPDIIKEQLLYIYLRERDITPHLLTVISKLATYF
jgi:hypothetical protein